MDIDLIRSQLEEHFPQWAGRIRLLRFFPTPRVLIADNDGRNIYYNEQHLLRYTAEDKLFFMAQQLLHIQLAHFSRRGGREVFLWKRACDGIVNSMLRSEGFHPPADLFLVRDAEKYSAEELYRLLLLHGPPPETPEDAELQELPEWAQTGEEQQAGGETEEQERTVDDPGLAAAVAGLAEMLEPSMELDFDWFPGSTIRDGMLRYDFRAYPVAKAEILLDTSASVDEALLRYFVRGVKALMREDAIVKVGCFDTRFYGFTEVFTEEDIENLELQGSGGTDFTVAINAFTGDAENQIIFTDGYAEMPEESCNAIWVVHGNMVIHPKGGRVIYVRPSEEKEKHEIDFLIT